MKQSFLVLRPDLSPEQVEEALEDLGLEWDGTLEGDGQRIAHEEIWVAPDETQVVAVVACPLVNKVYLAIRGEDVEALATELHARIPTYSRAECLALASSASVHDDRVRALYRIAVTFHEFDAEAFEIFRAFSVDAPDALLREAAVDAMVYRCWSEFAPLLERIIQADPAETVRERAAAILPHVLAAGTQE